VVYYIYLLIGTSSFDLCILLSFPAPLIEFEEETNSYHFFFRAVAFDFFPVQAQETKRSGYAVGTASMS